MSTLIVAAILIISTFTISLVFVLLSRKKAARQKDKLLNLFSHAGTKYGLSFTSQEVLKDKIIGFDGLHQTFVVFEFANAGNVTRINMGDVKSITVKKEYDTVNDGSGKNAKVEKHLRSIDLTFSLRNAFEPVSVSFYDSSVASIFEMAELEARAKGWESVLKKLILKEVKAGA